MVKIKRVGLLKGSLLGMFLSLIVSFVSGFFIFFVQSIVLSLLPLALLGQSEASIGISNISLFVYYPLLSLVTGFIGTFILLVIFNLSLKIINGWDIDIDDGLGVRNIIKIPNSSINNN